VNITSDNDPPIANPDAFTVDAGATTELDVLANDSIAPDAGETLRISSKTTGSAGGTIAISDDGTRIVYTPATGFTGVETFSYGASDRPDFSGLVSTALVTVTVRDNNPITGDDFATVVEDSQDNVIDVLANDEPAAGVGGDLEIISAELMGSAGTVTVGPNDGTILFTPAANFAGMALLSYRVRDVQGGESTGMVVVTVTNVNDPPNANDDTPSVAEDSANNTLNVLANDVIAPDTGEVLTITAVGPTSNGGIVTIAPSGNSLIYTPPADFVGQDAFTYTISDGNGGSDTATVVVTITDATEMPTANDDTATVAEDSSDNPIDVLANDTDPDAGETLTVMAVTQGSRGGTVEIAEDGLSVLYTPAANVFGEETFTYTASDGNGGTDTATVTVQITGSNDPPIAVNDTATVVEESTDNTIDVLANDSIAPDDTGTLVITAVGTASAGGTVEIAQDGLSYI
jgi:VCBS repeat-containing protein